SPTNDAPPHPPPTPPLHDRSSDLPSGAVACGTHADAAGEGTRDRRSPAQRLRPQHDELPARQLAQLAQHRARERSARRPPLEHRSEEHTSELQSPYDLVCRLLLEK